MMNFLVSQFLLPIARAEDIGSQTGLGTANVKQVAVNVVSLLISYVPLVALVMVIIGGLMWMTSAGNEEKIARAKVTISAAIIGVIIVLLSWAIVIYVAGTARNVTH